MTDPQTPSVAAAADVMLRLANESAKHQRLPMLDVVFDRSVQMLTESFLHLMPTDVTVSLTDVTHARFGECVAGAAGEHVIAVVRAVEWDTSFLIMIDSAMIFSLVEILLGGSASAARAPRAADRRPTAIEMQLAKRVMTLCADRFADAFATISEVTFEVERLEMNAQFAAITRNTSAAVSGSMELSIAKTRGELRAVFPYTSLEAVKTSLQQMFMGERFGRDEAWEQHFRDCLSATDLTLEAILYQTECSLKSVLEWQKGTVLEFDAAAEADVHLLCEGETFFRGPMGRKGSRIAAKVEKVLVGTEFSDQSSDDALVQEDDNAELTPFAEAI